jgi:hypothetical protein
VDPTIEPGIAPPARKGKKKAPVTDESVVFKDGSDLEESSDPEWATEDRTIVGELIEDEIEEPEKRLVLTLEERTDLAKLLTVGRRTKKITLAGHQVTIQTLKGDDEMRIGLFTKPYLDTQGFARAYHVGVCAASVVEIKGQPLWDSLMPIEDPTERFNKNVEAIGQFYPIVISRLYDAVMDLEREFAQLALKLNLLGDLAKK